ncbi:MAG: hypothetical protein V2B18_08440, partial [Pseudomonadota bacterium]
MENAFPGEGPPSPKTIQGSHAGTGDYVGEVGRLRIKPVWKLADGNGLVEQKRFDVRYHACEFCSIVS